MPGDTGLFQLNDVVLNIPPQQIQVDKKSVNHMWNTLRTKSSIKSKSGFSNIRIMVTVKFTTTLRGARGNSILNGLEQLRNLVAQFRVTPFCYVENQFIRNSVLAGSSEPVMALALEQLQITKENESTNTVEVIMFFQWFNYFPFLRQWAYKKDFFSAMSERDPRKSRPWKVMYQAEQERGKYTAIKELNDKATYLQFQQFATLTVEQYREIEKDHDAFIRLQEDVAVAIEATDSKQNANTLINMSLTQSRGQERASLLREEMFGYTTSIGPEEDLTLQKAADVLTKGLADTTESRFNLLDKLIWQVVVNKHGETISYSNTPQAPRKEIGNIGLENTLLMERQRHIALNSLEGGLIVTGLTISFENILAQLPLVGHPYPTFQHIGSIDAVVTMSIITTSEEALSALTNFYNTVEDQAYKFKNIPQGQRNIIIKNPLINMCGLHEFIPNTLVTGTVPGQPGTYAASLELIDNPLNSSTREEIQPGQRFQTRADIRNAVSDVLLENLTFDRYEVSVFGSPGDGTYKYSSKGKTSADPDRHLAFKKLCEEYGRHFGELHNELRDVFGTTNYLNKNNVPPVSEFYSLNNDDVPSIQRMQEDMFGRLKRHKSFNNSLNKPSTLKHAKEQALFNIERSRALGIAHVQKAELIRRGDSEVDEATREFLKSSHIEQVEELQVDRVPIFINDHLQDWLTFSVPFLDKITFSDMLNLPQFDVVKELIQQNTQSSGGDCYPDFPLRQVIELMQSSDEQALKSATEELVHQSETSSLGLKNMGLSTLIQPDFYMYNTQNDDLNDLIPFNIQDAAIKSILDAQDEVKQDAEKGWLEGITDHKTRKQRPGYEAKLGRNLAEQIRRDAADQQFDKKFWGGAISTTTLVTTATAVVPSVAPVAAAIGLAAISKDAAVKREEVREAVRTQIQLSGGDFHFQDLVDVEDGLPCSILSETIHYDPIELKKMDLSAFNVVGAARPPGLMVLKNRPSAVLQADVAHHSKARHRFGTDSITRRPESSYIAAPQQVDLGKEPDWKWPTDPNCQVITRKMSRTNTYHPTLGIDIKNPKITKNFDKTADLLKAIKAKTHTRVIRPHKGIDIAAYGGAYRKPVRVIADGEIERVSKYPWSLNEGSKNKAGAGNMIIVKHANGYRSKYFHLDWSGETVTVSDLFHGRIPGILGVDFLSALPKTLATALTGGSKVTGFLGLKKGFKVKQGQIIGRIGNTGTGTKGKKVGGGSHLHFEIWKDNDYLDPEPRVKGESRKSQGPLTGINPANESLLTKSIEQLEKDMRNGQGYSLMRAYPTFRLYFIESDLGERKRFGFDDFFSYSSIKDMRVIRSRQVGVDLAIITMTNVSGVLSNRKFKELADPDDPRNKNGNILKEDPLDPTLTNTADENPLASLMLKPGQQMQLRLGYNNSPDELETVINGVITDVQFSESDDMVTIICQSFAVELVQNQHGSVKSFGGFMSNSGRTGKLLEELMTMPEVVHFGRWEGGKATNTVYGALRNEWNFVPSPQDDNIFAPQGRGLWGIFDSTEEYSMYHSTIWDTFQEMTLRHPSYCAYPVPYEGKWGPRMTMFFGLPDQLYFARDPSLVEDNKLEGIKKVINDAVDVLKESRSDFEKLLDPNTPTLSSKTSSVLTTALAISPIGWSALISNALLKEGAKELDPYEQARKFWIKQQTKRFSLDQGFIKPFRNYHVLTSTQHILMNNIESSSNVFNTVTLQYGDKEASVNEQEQRLDFGDLDTFSLKADAAIKDEDIKEMFAQYPNCVGYEMAKRYAVGLLNYSMKENYRGSIVIVGNPRIKPTDVCFTKGTLILTDKGYKPIEEVVIGDTVYSHKVKQQRVDQVFKRKPYGEILSVKCKTDPDVLIGTYNHPVLSVKRNEVFDDNKPWKGRSLDFNPKFRQLCDLKRKDYLVIPRIRSQKSLSPSLARLLGYYLAEGSIVWEWRKSFNRRFGKRTSEVYPTKCCRVPIGINWAFNSETEFFMVDIINGLLEDMGLKKKAIYFIDKNKKSLSITLHDRDLTSDFIRLAGYSNPVDKRENKWLREFYNKDTTKYILAAYFEGDGCVGKNRSITSVTTSMILGRNIRQLLINVGVPVLSFIAKGNTSYKKDVIAYTNVVGSCFSYLFASYFEKLSRFTVIDENPSSHQDNNSAFCDNLYAYIPVDNIEKVGDVDYVYNIGVANDHTYVANNKVVHNCFIFDEYTDMFGPIEVEQVVHKFSQDTGFITEITPDLVVHVNQLSTMSTSDAMGLMAEAALRRIGLQSSPSLKTAASGAVTTGAVGASTTGSMAALAAGVGSGAIISNIAFTPIANMFFNSSENAMSQSGSSLFGLVGTFIFKKLITRSQLAHPFRYSPLVKGGHAMVGGLPIAKTEGSFTQSLGERIRKWAKDADQGIGLLLTDTVDKYHPNNWLDRTQGDFYDTLLYR